MSPTELTSKQEAKVDELLQRITSAYPTPPPQLATAMCETKDKSAPTLRNPTRLYAYAFLVSRKWDVDKAFEMAEQVVKFREEDRSDTRSIFPSPFSIRGWSETAVAEYFDMKTREKEKSDIIGAGVDRNLQCGLHYWDKQGIPVFYIMIGRVNETGMIKRLKKMADIGQTADEVMWPYLNHYMLAMEYLARFQQHQKETGKLTEGVEKNDNVIRAVTIVMDATGLSYKMLWKPAVELLTRSLKRMFTVFPDCVSRIMVVNSPSVVRVAYALVRPVLDENLQAKVHIYSPSDTLSALEAVIDKKFIPSFLGGECKCGGNCIKMFDPDAPKAKKGAEEEEDGEGTEDIKVSARYKVEREVAVETNDIVTFDFAGSEIEFILYFIPEGELSDRKEKKDLSKTRHKNYVILQGTYKALSDQVTATGPGKVVLQFDNTAAWVSASRLQLKILKIPASHGDESKVSEDVSTCEGSSNDCNETTAGEDACEAHGCGAEANSRTASTHDQSTSGFREGC